MIFTGIFVGKFVLRFSQKIYFEWKQTEKALMCIGLSAYV